MAENSVYAVAIDSTGAKWFGTLDSGVSKFDGSSWVATSDSQTPANGLSHDIQAGSILGGSDILSSMASSSGYRRVPQPGSTGPGLTAILTLPNGTYYWSVQAIDTAWTGSAFATQSVFTVPVPLDSVSLTGPATGLVDSWYTLTATTSSVTATVPITYPEAIYLPILKQPSVPEPGYWKKDSPYTEFYVSTGSLFVEDFAVKSQCL